MVSWESAQLNIIELNTDLINREETCPRPPGLYKTQFMAFNMKKSFDDSVKFCEKQDGQIAVVNDVETFFLMLKTFDEVCEIEEGGEYTFFSGHTDRQVEGEWRDFNTGRVEHSHWSRSLQNPDTVLWLVELCCH